MIKDGKDRKERIFEKLFHTERKTRLQMSLYSTAFMMIWWWNGMESMSTRRTVCLQSKVFVDVLVDFVKIIIAQNQDIKRL